MGIFLVYFICLLAYWVFYDFMQRGLLKTIQVANSQKELFQNGGNYKLNKNNKN